MSDIQKQREAKYEEVMSILCTCTTDELACPVPGHIEASQKCRDEQEAEYVHECGEVLSSRTAFLAHDQECEAGR